MTNRPRDVGILLFLGADALFFLGCFVMYGFARARAGAWPDVPEAQQLGAALPLLAAGCLVLGALAYRARLHPLFAFAAAAGTLVLVGFLWFEGAQRGLRPSIDAWGRGRYGFVAYGLTLLWSLHVVAALAALGVHAVRRRFTPLVGRFLLFQAGIGVLLVVTVFLL